MTSKGHGLGILLMACVVGLVGAGSAFASFSPTLQATTQAAGTVISYSQGDSDDPLAATSFYVPAGYNGLLADSPGTVIGSITALAASADLNNAKLPLTGSIVVSGAAESIPFAGTTATVGALATACTGSAAHGAFWLLNLA